MTDYQSFGTLFSRNFNWKGTNAKNIVKKKNWLIYLNDCNFRTRLEARRRDQQQLLPRIWDINDKWLERNGRVKCGSNVYHHPTFAVIYPMHQYFELVETWKLYLISMCHVFINSYLGFLCPTRKLLYNVDPSKVILQIFQSLFVKWATRCIDFWVIWMEGERPHIVHARLKFSWRH